MAYYKKGPFRVYEIRFRFEDIDWGLALADYQRGKCAYNIPKLFENVEKARKAGAKVIEFAYVGVTTNEVYTRVKQHMNTKGSRGYELLHYLKKEPEFTFTRLMPSGGKKEQEKYEILYMNALEKYFLELFLDHKIFTFAWGPYFENIDKNGVKRAQKEYPFPDTKYKEWYPKWFRNYLRGKDEEEAKSAARDAIVEESL